MTLSQQLFKSCRLQRHQNANILLRLSYETPNTFAVFIYFHFFSNIIHFSHCFWELFFAVSHDMFNTTCAFLFKSIVLTFLTKISTANSIWGFRNVDKVLFIFFSLSLFFYTYYVLYFPFNFKLEDPLQMCSFHFICLPRVRCFLSQFWFKNVNGMEYVRVLLQEIGNISKFQAMPNLHPWNRNTF